MLDDFSQVPGGNGPKIEISPSAKVFVDKYKVEINEAGLAYLDEDGDVVNIASPVSSPKAIHVSGNQEKIRIRFTAQDGSSGDVGLKEEKFPKPHVEKV